MCVLAFCFPVLLDIALTSAVLIDKGKDRTICYFNQLWFLLFGYVPHLELELLWSNHVFHIHFEIIDFQ